MIINVEKLFDVVLNKLVYEPLEKISKLLKYIYWCNFRVKCIHNFFCFFW